MNFIQTSSHFIKMQKEYQINKLGKDKYCIFHKLSLKISLLQRATTLSFYVSFCKIKLYFESC